MKKKTNETVCKQCGKIIVGASKVGLCESCFSKDAEVALGAAGVSAILWKLIKKYGPKLLKDALEFYKKFK